MSIIHDALKKVQQTNAAGPYAPPPPPATPAPAPASQEGINMPLAALATCAVLFLIAVASMLILARNPAVSARRRPAPLPAATTAAPGAFAQAAATAVTAPAVPLIPAPSLNREKPSRMPPDPNDPLSGLQIEGVMDMGGKKVVLINGNVYEEGQAIYGRVIIQVNFDAITVMDNGSKRIFPVKP